MSNITAKVSYVDDDNIASYYFSLGTDLDYVLENTLPFTPTYSYSAAGQYVINSATNGWTSQKTIVFINPGYMPSGFVNTGVALGWERNSNSAITIKSKDTSTGTDTDGLVFLATIEIRVYN